MIMMLRCGKIGYEISFQCITLILVLEQSASKRMKGKLIFALNTLQRAGYTSIPKIQFWAFHAGFIEILMTQRRQMNHKSQTKYSYTRLNVTRNHGSNLEKYGIRFHIFLTFTNSKNQICATTEISTLQSLGNCTT
jgi:hypothetical protein